MRNAPHSLQKQRPVATNPSLPTDRAQKNQYPMGKSQRDKCPRQDQVVWQAPGKWPNPVTLIEELHGCTLARALGRAGRNQRPPGESRLFAKALADLSIASADQSERDHEGLVQAARSENLADFVDGE